MDMKNFFDFSAGKNGAIHDFCRKCRENLNFEKRPLLLCFITGTLLYSFIELIARQSFSSFTDFCINASFAFAYNALIVILTPLHRLDEVKPAGENARLGKPDDLREYVKMIREVAEYYSLPVLDLYACSGLQPNVPAILERYVPDGLHPNSAGHKILAELIAQFLTEQLRHLRGRGRI
nr:SGNH/GDSL hydrolase family protein [Clostridia bacterium]